MPALPTKLQPPVDVSRDHISGAAGAPVTLVEYGDYQCTYCRLAHAGIERLRDERLPGQLRYAFRHLPNMRLHPQAQIAAEAAEAASAQGRFWDMHEYLLTHAAAELNLVSPDHPVARTRRGLGLVLPRQTVYGIGQSKCKPGIKMS